MEYILGIRHHGPGSARHLVETLENIQPDILLIEGPPEGEEMLTWVAHSKMKPPVALLGYVPDTPQQAVFYPFSEFSPEWQAIQYAAKHNLPTRFIDVPLMHKLAGKAQDEQSVEEEENKNTTENVEEVLDIDRDIPWRNPLSYLAEIAGFEDAELWWEHQFEIASQPLEVFDAIAEAMTSLRENLPNREDKNEEIREAFMRKGLRNAQKQQFKKIVVICGAWHVPALKNMPPAKEDNELLKNLPKTKIATTWIPWTNQKLSRESGYGAGVNSPGWYQHCWQHPKDDGTIWLSHAANVFRKNQFDISSAHIIEAVRLANNLAALRNFSKASLLELNEATQSVMCMGDDMPMKIIWNELIVGKEMGTVPTGTPQVPLQKDFEQTIKKLRLKQSADSAPLALDLRKETDLQKSIFLHRLAILEIPWGRLMYARGKGTFKEEWTLTWYPELTLQLLDKASWGNTFEEAGNQYLTHLAKETQQLDKVTVLLQRAIPAELTEGTKQIVQRIDALSTSTSDILTLIKTFPPLAQVRRYGNVRNTDLETIGLMLYAIFYRVTAGLPVGSTGIDQAQATTLTESIGQMHQAVLMLDEEELRLNWIDALKKTSTMQTAAPKVQGFCYKLRYDLQELSPEATAQAFSQALSIGNPPAFAAAWLEGFLQDAANILLVDEVIWDIINDWVASLNDENFTEVVPLLRRTFANYSSPERQKIAQKAKQGKLSRSQSQASFEIDHARAQKVLPLMYKIFGV